MIEGLRRLMNSRAPVRFGIYLISVFVATLCLSASSTELKRDTFVWFVLATLLLAGGGRLCAGPISRREKPEGPTPELPPSDPVLASEAPEVAPGRRSGLKPAAR
jgi:hypothetical protein